MDQKKVLIAISVPFPYNTAFSSRARAFCKIFSDIGYSVHVVAIYASDKQYKTGEIYKKDDYTFEVVSSKGVRSIDSFVGVNGYIKRVEEILRTQKISFIFSDGNQLYFNAMHKIASKYDVPLYIEQCEKYVSESYKFKKFDIRYLNFMRHYNFCYKKSDGIVAISRLLQNHYLSQKVKAIRIPTILDVENFQYSVTANNSPVNLVFTGTVIGKKELLLPIIKVLSSKEEYISNIVFHIYGTSIEDFLRDEQSVSKKDLLSLKNVFFHGRVPQQQIEDIVRNSDYQIFVRPDRESSHAGFPTKFGESMALGTPVICNLTGDIELYLKDGLNGFVIGNNVEQSLSEIFDRIIVLSGDEKKSLRTNARKIAEKHFNCKSYVEEMKGFLKE